MRPSQQSNKQQRWVHKVSLSDELFEFEEIVIERLSDSDFLPCYGEAIKSRLEFILEEVDALRLEPGLDTMPDTPRPARRSADEIIRCFKALVGPFAARFQ
jgi:hypothetical protein